ncbi:MAG: hypothetical protein ABW328_10470, partial [Ilumatobacteraceae bacterium]
VREGDNVWVFDDAGRFALPRFGVEAIGSRWFDRGLQANVAFAEGRVLNGAGPARGMGPLGADGVPRIFGAGPVRLECVEPFHRWTTQWHGPMRDTDAEEQLAGIVSERKVDVDVELEMSMVVPPWVQGEMSPEADKLLKNEIEGAFMGGVRHEQLFRCRGSLRVGEDQYTFTGTGLRIHRIGVRNATEFWGHNWQSAVFPSGRAFGFIVFPPRPDGSPSYAEGFVYDGGVMHPARIVEVRWLTEIVPTGGDVSVVLETEEHGTITIGGTTCCSTFSPQGGNLHLAWAADGPEARNPVTFHQGGARYTWGEEETYGMVERSLPDAKIEGRAAL